MAMTCEINWHAADFQYLGVFSYLLGSFNQSDTNSGVITDNVGGAAAEGPSGACAANCLDKLEDNCCNN